MKEEARSLVKELIKISSTCDDKNYGDLSGKLIKCAKKIQTEIVEEKDLVEVVDDLVKAGFNQEANLIKEAISWAELKGGIGGMFGNVADAWRQGRIKGAIDDIIVRINNVLKSTSAILPKINDTAMKSKMDNMIKNLGYMKTLGGYINESVNFIDEMAAPAAAQQPASQQLAAQQPAISQKLKGLKKGDSIKYQVGREVRVGKYQGINSDGQVAVLDKNNKPFTVLQNQIIFDSSPEASSPREVMPGQPSELRQHAKFNLKMYKINN